MKPSAFLHLLLVAGMLGLFNFSGLQATTVSAHAVCPCCSAGDASHPCQMPCHDCAVTKAAPFHQQIIAVRPAEITPRIDVAMFFIVPVVAEHFQISVNSVAHRQTTSWPGRSCAPQAWLRLWLI